MYTKPIICLIHGVWFPSAVFAPLISSLWQDGYPTWTADLPSSFGDPSKSVSDDITFLHQSFAELIDKGRDLVVVGWSYGGGVGPAATENLLKTDDKSNGVIGYVYAATFIPPKDNMTSQEVLAAYGNDKWLSPEVSAASNISFGPLVTLGNAEPIFYNDSPYKNISEFLDHQVKPLSALAFTTPLTYSPYDGTKFAKPAAYIHTLDDINVPSTVQSEFLDKYKGAFQSVIDLKSGHLFMIDQPEKAAKGIIKFVESLGS